jgi:UDP-N-acetylglucosamine diphosphorylase / glucose-1-phosphate thymidylyltransferase / UDP-N-acetylgalactosamine diphosphorylase / glucosamine-1-phosphate N-acetyltransferase / galactosamine-1-phosphate N-acetyltransferase
VTEKRATRSRFAEQSAESKATQPVAGALPLVLYDDAIARAFEPFALTRPIATLVSGVASISQRWSMALQVRCGGCIAAPHLADFDEDPGAVSGTLPAGTIVANARFAPALEMIGERPGSVRGTSQDMQAGAWVNAGRVAAVRLRKALAVDEFTSGTLTLESLARGESHVAKIDGWWHDEVWDFIKHLPDALADDITRMEKLPAYRNQFGAWTAPSHVTIIGDHPVLVWANNPGSGDAPPAMIEPQVVLDATAGPILIESGVHIRSFTRITGPCRIGRGSTILSGDVTGCSIGPVSKIRGEIAGCIVLGFSNKGHEGFVGHSYLGRWVNLGAGTTTSNLKNTYGKVSLWTPVGVRDTGMQFLGTLFGDHVKTGIGTLLTTGTVLGAAANIYGSSMPPKVVAPFAWGEGEPYDTYRLDKFLSSTAAMMQRRHVTLSDRAKRQLSASFAGRWSTSEPLKKVETRPVRKTVAKKRSGDR